MMVGMNKQTKTKIIRITALVFVVMLTLLLYLNRSRVQELEALGYPGIFLISALSNASLVLPVPGVLFTSAMGAVFNPFWVAIAAGSGAALGELSGYLAGFSGQGVIERRDWADKVTGWMQRFGGWAIIVLALIPNPLFDLAGITAGALKMPVWKFLIYCWIGKVLKMMVFAYGGSVILGWFPT